MDDPRPALRIRQLAAHLGGGSGGACSSACAAAAAAPSPLAALHCRAADNAAVPEASKVCSAEEAVALIPDGEDLSHAK